MKARQIMWDEKKHRQYEISRDKQPAPNVNPNKRPKSKYIKNFKKY